MPFVVVDVGCMECGVDTVFLGVYEESHEALQIESDQRCLYHTRSGYRDGGRAEIMIFDTETLERFTL